MKLFKTHPPLGWLPEHGKSDLDLWSRLLSGYKKNDVVSRVIKKDRTIVNIKKIDAQLISKSISQNILRLLNSNNRSAGNQIKIFGAFNACEESFYMMLASADLCAHHCIVFPELSETALANRINIFQPDIILCKHEHKDKINQSLEKIKDKQIPLLVVSIDRDGIRNEYAKKEVKASLFNDTQKWYKANDSLFTLFTSGSTGIPKGVTHNPTGYIDYAEATTKTFFGVTSGKTIFTATDAGWINGHTYAFYGPLLCGGVSVICEYLPALLIPRLLIDFLTRTKVDIFYTSVTALRGIKSFVNDGQNVTTLSNGKVNLERIGSCGEPLAEAVGSWSIEFFKPRIKNIVNTYFQTETGGILLAPKLNDSIGRKFSSIGSRGTNQSLNLAKDVMSEAELKSENIQPNELLVVSPWSGIFKEIISDKPQNYFTSKGFFRLRDEGFYDDEGFWFIGGRTDDVINVLGHRISTAEIESIALTFAQITESCVVPVADEMYGSRPILYVSTVEMSKEDEASLEKELSGYIKEKLSSYHLPKQINVFQSLPKTKSGKIMRRLMKSYAEGCLDFNSTDMTTLANKEEFLELVLSSQSRK